MKKVSGYISVRVLGCYDFEFYVDDDCTDEEIKARVDAVCQCYINYDVEPGYKKRVVEEYYKEEDYEF